MPHMVAFSPLFISLRNPAAHPSWPAQLKAAMALRRLSLKEVAARAEVPYTKASEVLNGRRICARTLSALERSVASLSTATAK